MSVVRISHFYDKVLEDAKALVAANLLEGWSISFYTGWGASVRMPSGEEATDWARCPKSVVDLANFADRVIELGGGDNTWVVGAKKPRKVRRGPLGTAPIGHTGHTPSKTQAAPEN